MKYLFVINPAAGKEGSEEGLLAALKQRKDFDYDIYYTKTKKDATNYCRNMCQQNPNTQFCFVSCGGDGTLCEVVNGIIGFDNASLAVYPIGSGNDFVKYFGDKAAFFDLDGLLKGTHVKVDAIRVKDLYSINVASFGFDCGVIKTMEKVKRKPLVGGNNAYTTGIVTSLFTATVNKASVIADGELLNQSGKYLLCTIANGAYVGGGYYCAPRSVCDDGLLEVCLVKTMSVFRMVPLISKYKKGLHLDDESLRDVIEYRRCKQVQIVSQEKMAVSVDGELVEDYFFEIEIVPRTIDFIIPQGCYQ